MAKSEIVRTYISGKTVHIAIANNKDLDKATEKISIETEVDYDRRRPVAELQLEVLRYARNVVNHQIQEIEQIAGRNP